ncbi:hypothetical protein TVAG_182440 [Trichomonas vaginalis G3]|uniref:Uncharacterized protein n=1 Tax=Trichomonas vaginalis (strain ATCC PRA-98 / G3) TaxID=412133 RepID=A2D8Y2_TRIV3|nr:hypothetical protein TVAGG3_0543930 [Trichomonas vaginalis G3]EAY23008.1 hypothetical protein TVAG_182440 [Trichomonas vaginalis G3]KAI5520039.1 hypothetical protein TVAGG3_0543930 [Trichomonas vaginalis G3]|eukprot:XP_001583994.1 hypothetical protein [Trichomonas vaginalis G3]
MDFPTIDNPFYRESLRPLKPTAQQLNDKRYKPTVEAIYLRRSEQPEYNVPILPKEGRIQVPVRDGKPGDPNRHAARAIKQDEKQDEFFEFQEYERQYNELRLRIAAIREKSKMYPVWANDNPSIPASLNRKFGDLNQQLFALKKCFVSPEEIMLDNTAALIQRFWRSKLRKNTLRKAMEAIHNYKVRELQQTHRSLNSWLAQMEYSDSRAQQFRFRSISKVSKYASKQWIKWAEREAYQTNRNESKALDLQQKLTEKRHKRALVQWKEIAMGPRSRKAMAKWRTSMVPKMKAELEKVGREAPQEYIPLVSAYVELRNQHSFLFNFFIAWHARFHSKSLRETVSDRNAAILYKKHCLTRTFKFWLTNVRQTKEFLKTKEKWDRYIKLSRSQHQQRMAVVRALVTKWHAYSRDRVILRHKRKSNDEKLTRGTFIAWKDTTQKHREMKMKAIEMWKRHIQDPKVAVFRKWRIYAIKKRAQHQMDNLLFQSGQQWRARRVLDEAFAKWQLAYGKNKNARAGKALEQRKWYLQSTKQNTTMLSAEYAKEREKIAAIEKNLGDVTTQFIQTEDEIARLEDVTTTWKIALHAMKMEYIRLATIVEKCATSSVRKQRRMSDDDFYERINNDDRYMQGSKSRLNNFKTADRVVGKWERRNSDPEINPQEYVDLKPPLDDAIIQLLQLDKDI